MKNVALTFGSRVWSWAHVDAQVDEVQARLLSAGLQRGARVVVASFNSPALVFACLATWRAGAVFVPINARLTEHEQARLLEAAGAGRAVLDWRPHLEGQDDAVDDAARGATPATSVVGSNPDDQSADPTRIAAALFTSGTTGAPKLVELSHSNFVANARASARNIGGDTPGDAWLATLPLFHIGGLAMLYRWLLARSHLALEAHFDAARVSRWLESGAMTHASVVPTTLMRVIDANAGRGFSPNVKAVLVGGGPMSPELLARARALRLPVLQTYGLTEACSQVATERLADADGTTAGQPLEGTEVKIVDGEIYVRGPTVCLERGAWLATGDLGALDERNRLTVFSRRADLIITGGENVYPAEVERELAGHPAIAEVVVAPRADATWGQVPVAFVVWRGPPAEAEVLAWARERLAGFKVPRAIVSISEVPRNANGKVERGRFKGTTASN